MNRNYENSYQWKNIDTNKVNLLLKNFKHFTTDKGNDAKIVSEYIEKMQRLGELKHFTVTLFGQGEGEKKTIFDKYEIIFNKRMVRNSDLVTTVNFGALTREAAEGADAIVVLTEWTEFKVLDWKNIFKTMRKPAWIFDTRIILDRKELREIGFRVWTVGYE